MKKGQIRLVVLGAALALGFGGAAQARGHASHGGSPATRSLGGRHGTIIVFGGERGVRSHLAPREIGLFGGRFGHRFHGSSFAGSYGHSGGGIQCVTFARADSGIELSGNASAWWGNAEGVYQRGSRPEPGSVLNFRANGAMRMGHVAVVNQVVDSRTIQIDHANWGGPGAVRGGVSRDISVVDVSPANDWSAVRVALGHSDEYGSIYPTFGFIYNRPDRGTLIAANDRTTPVPAMNPAPRDLRGLSDAAFDEVAEAPDSPEVMPGRRSLGRRHARHVILASAHRRSHHRYD